MLRDITIGQYYSVDSYLHRLDPRVKILGLLVIIVTLFAVGNPITYILTGAFTGVLIYASRVPFKYIIKGLKPLWVLLLCTNILNLFMTEGIALISVWKLTITKEGVILALTITTRIVLLIIVSSLLTLTTTPTRLTDALEKILNPLNKIKIPVHEIAMMISIALRFIPILVEEADLIMKAQSARCMNLNSGNIFKRIKNMLPIIIPLFVSAIRRANELSLAMEARCYRGGSGRTKMKPLKYEKKDFAAYCFVVAYMLILIGINIVV